MKTEKEIRFYYINYDMFHKAANVIGENRVVCLAEKYNEAMKLAPVKLFKLMFASILTTED